MGSLPCVVLLALLAGAAGREKQLTGEYEAAMTFGRGERVRIVYQVTVRRRGALSFSGGTEVLLSGEPERAKEGRSGLIVYGRLDAFGGSKAPVSFVGLNAARVKIGSTEGRDDLKKKPVLTFARLYRAVFRDLALAVCNGRVEFRQCVFINAPLTIDGGNVTIENCTFLHPSGTALEILRSDTYPNVVIRCAQFLRSATALSIRKETVRPRRGQLLITGCNFEGNETDIYYEDVVHFLLQGCYLGGLGPREVAEHLRYLDDPDRPGRVLLAAVRRKPLKQAGSALVRDGLVKLPGEKEPPATPGAREGD